MNIRSLLIALLAGILGLILWADDNLVIMLNIVSQESAARRLCDTLEFFLLVPGAAALGWFVAERLRHSSDRLSRMQQQLYRDRMVALGRVAASLAHEVRNPLHNLRLIMESLRQPGMLSEQDHLKDMADENILRIDQAVNLVYRLARRRAVTVTNCVCDLGRIIGESVEAEQERIPGTVIRWDGRAGARATCLDEDVRTVMDNLLRNASAAAGKDGIDVSLCEAGDAWEVLIVNLGTLPAWVVENDETLQGESSTGGLGLGLSISRQIIVEAGGTLRLSQNGPRVEARLRLPRATGIGA